MAFTPNWIDLPSGTYADGTNGGERSESVVFDPSTNTLWGAFIRLGLFSIPTLFWYKSTDFGVTWVDTGLNVGNDFDPSFTASLNRTIFIAGTTVYFFGMKSSGTDIYASTFDLSSPTNPWTAWVTLPFSTNSSSYQSHGTFYAGPRPDGSIVVIYPTNDGGTPTTSVQKLVGGIGGTWTSLGTIGGNTPNFLSVFQSACMSASGVIYLLDMEASPLPVSTPTDLCCTTIDPATDAISSPTIVQSGVEDGYWDFVNLGPGDISGSTLAYAFGYRAATNFSNTQTYGTLKVAFGDLTVPLVPTWTLTTVNATPDISVNWSWEHNNCLCQVAFVGTVPWVYYVTPYPSALTGTNSANQGRLKRSSYVSGAWTAPVDWYDPNLDSTVNGLTNHPVDTFQLVRAFGSAGVGIMLDVGEIYAAYEGPSVIQSGCRYYCD